MKRKNESTFNLYLQLCVITFPHNIPQLHYTFANVEQVSEFHPGVLDLVLSHKLAPPMYSC